jgi:hypothetical protein
MDKKTLVSLIACLFALASSGSFAQRPAAEAETETAQPAAVANEVATPDMRPAAEGSMVEPMETHSETSTSGDVLDMGVQPPADAVAAPVRQLDFPRRGMSQDKVQNELGRPIEIIPPIGQPPISRWVYDDRVIYFEYSSVVHVVAK